MATSDKLNYILETKDAIKSSIRNKGVVLEDTAPFNTYPSKIDEITIEVETENIEITPTKEVQTINRSEDKYIESVKVYAIPDEYIIPSGNLEITENGNYNVVDKESVDVNVQPILGTKTITENGIYNAIDDNLDGYSSVEVETSGVDINEYMSVTPTAYTNYSGVGGWITTIKKLVGFEISGQTSLRYLFGFFQGEEIDLSGIDTVGVNDMSYMFVACSNLKKIDLSNFDTSSVTNINNMFYNATSIKSVGPGEEYDINIKNFDASNVTNMNSLFNHCPQLTTVNLSNFDISKVTEMASIFFQDGRLTNVDLSGFDTSNVISINSMFRGASSLVNLDISNFDLGKAYTLSYAFMDCSALENLIFARNVGKGFANRTTANYYSCTLDLSNCRKLTYDSLMSVINNLYDLNLTYDVANGGTLYTQQLVLGTTNLAKLTTDEINIAVSKGWSVS